MSDGKITYLAILGLAKNNYPFTRHVIAFLKMLRRSSEMGDATRRTHKIYGSNGYDALHSTQLCSALWNLHLKFCTWQAENAKKVQLQ